MSGRFRVECECGHVMRVAAELLGRVGACPDCGETFLLWSQTAAEADHGGAWYVQMDGRVRGPVSFLGLRRLVSENRVGPASLVREGQDGDWIPAQAVKGRIDVGDARDRIGVDYRSRRRNLRRRRVSLDPKFVRFGAAILACLLLGALWLALDAGEKEDEGPERLTSTEVARRTLPSVAAIRGQHSMGSGFIVGPGLLVTNYHVIERELLRNITIEFPDAEGPVRAVASTLRYADPDRDLAFLEVSGDAAPLPLAGEHEFVAGQEVLVVGSPGLGGRIVLHNAVGRGLLSTETEIEGRPYYQLDVSVNPGNSGGPVIDDRGQVIAVLVAKAADRDGLAFAIPLGGLDESLTAARGVSARGASRQCALHRLRVAEKAVLPAAAVYHAAMQAYVRILDADSEEPGGEGGLGAFLEKVDRHLLTELRLEEREIRSDENLTARERKRFKELWAVYAELKRAVDVPEGSPNEYAALCASLGDRLRDLAAAVRSAGLDSGGDARR